jgi:hypothetical protein
LARQPEQGKSRRKSAVYGGVNEHFEPAFNAAMATQPVFQQPVGETLILFVIPARRFTTAEWLVKPEPILILFQWNQGQNGPRRMPG